MTEWERRKFWNEVLKGKRTDPASPVARKRYMNIGRLMEQHMPDRLYDVVIEPNNEQDDRPDHAGSGNDYTEYRPTGPRFSERTGTFGHHWIWKD